MSIKGKEEVIQRKPFDGYLVELHEGETIITAEQEIEWHKIVKEQEKESKDKESYRGCYSNNSAIIFSAIPLICIMTVVVIIILAIIQVN